MNSFERFSTKYLKLVLVILIPVYSIFSFMWFRKTKLNFTEHIVLNSYKTAAELVVGLLFSLLTIFYVNIKGLIFIYYFFVVFCTFLYSIWFYFQFFSGYGYTKKAVLVRSMMVPISYMIISLIIGIVVGIIKGLK